MNDWFIINDINDFTDKARAIVYNNFASWDSIKTNLDILIDDVAENEKAELDSILSHQEALVIVKDIVKKQKNKKHNSIRYMVSDRLFSKIIIDLNSRMVSNIVNSLVQKGVIESAFDNETNDFVFWIKDEQEKPETD